MDINMEDLTLYLKAILVFVVAMMCMKALSVAVLLPHKMRKTQRTLEIVIANAERAFKNMETSELENQSENQPENQPETSDNNNNKKDE